MIKLRFRVLIVGGGIIGLTTAYNIALQGVHDVAIVEKGYIGSGASTRNAAHFRVHFWAPQNTRFAIESNSRLMEFCSKIGRDPEIDHGGYLFLLHDEALVKAFKRSNTESWNPLGVPGRFLTPEETSEEYPYVNVEGAVAGFLGPQDGKLNPNIISLGYYKMNKELGIKFLDHTSAERLVIKAKKVKGVQTTAGFVEADKILVAAGAWTNEFLKTVNVDVPVQPERREIGVTEKIEYFIKPLVISTKNDSYVGQLLNGEVIGSIDHPIIKGLVPLANTLNWYRASAKAMSELIPIVKNLMILRSWAGYYAMTPDHSHIMGRDPEWPENLYVAAGFSGHGFGMAPFTGELMAKTILDNKVDELMKPFLPTRFKEDKLINETMIIG